MNAQELIDNVEIESNINTQAEEVLNHEIHHPLFILQLGASKDVCFKFNYIIPK